MTPLALVEQITSLGFPHAFNPYVDRCHIHDRHDAPNRRAAVLQAVLARASEVEIDAIWIGRDLGYRGGRRTGLALTDDVHIETHLARWGISTERPTHGIPVAERTAAVVWRMLNRIELGVFLWNVFPLHPHEPDDPFTNRLHTAAERRAGEEVLAQLIRLLRPKRIIAVGNNAAAAASRLAGLRPIMTVRHPSYGGQSQFLEQVASLYGLKEDVPPRLL